MSFFSSRFGNDTSKTIISEVDTINKLIQSVEFILEDGINDDSFKSMSEKYQEISSHFIVLASKIKNLGFFDSVNLTIEWVDGKKYKPQDWHLKLIYWMEMIENEVNIILNKDHNSSMYMFDITIQSVNRFLLRMLSLVDKTSSHDKGLNYKNEMKEYENEFNVLLQDLPKEIEMYRIDVKKTYVKKLNNKYVSYNKWLKEVNQKYNTLKESGAFNYNC